MDGLGFLESAATDIAVSLERLGGRLGSEDAVREFVRDQLGIDAPDALSARIFGVAMVHFVVRRNGQIDRLEVSKSSGNAGLDKAAIDIMQKAQPLPPIPDRMHTDRVEGTLPINFGVRSFSGATSAGSCR